jgi:hypothetical protein
MTRSRKDFYLVVSKETAQNLEIKQPTFFKCFETKKIEDFIPTPKITDFI